MKLLQKILFVLAISIFAETTEVSGMHPPALPIAAAVVGTNILDFNIFPHNTANIPAFLQPKIYRPAGHGGGNNLEYVYFTVIPNAPVAAANFINPAALTAIAHANDCNIFFPADGSQPTTANAVNYALANIDNRENSPITEWYMKMFGVIPFQNEHNPGANDYIKAGWTNPQPPADPVEERIVSYAFLEELVNNLKKIGEINIPSTPQFGTTPLNGINSVADINTKNKESLERLIENLDAPAFNALFVMVTAQAIAERAHAAIPIGGPGGATPIAINIATYVADTARELAIIVDKIARTTAVTAGAVAIPAGANTSTILVSLIQDVNVAMSNSQLAYAEAAAVGIGAANQASTDAQTIYVAANNSQLGIPIAPASDAADEVLDKISININTAFNAIKAAVPHARPDSAVAAENAAKSVVDATKAAIKLLKETRQSLRLLSQKNTKNETIGMFVNEMEIFFKENFRKIASTSVGRTMLYRILIEIRRKRNNLTNVGALENTIAAIPTLLTKRNSVRKIKIDFNDFSFGFNGKINITNSPIGFYEVISDIVGSGYDGITKHKDQADVSLFHEISHWYSYLRNVQRVICELNSSFDRIVHFNSRVSSFSAASGHTLLPATITPLFDENAIGSYYWNGLTAPDLPARMIESEKKWGVYGRPDYAEIRNILGVPVNPAASIPNPVPHTINGDDISENLYRMYSGLPLRFGHVSNGFSFYEDSRVIDKVIATCSLQRANYNFTTRNHWHVDKTYGNGRKGLGKADF